MAAGDREEQANDAVEREVDERSARQRLPSAFDLAFLSHVEHITEVLLVRHGQQDYDPTGPTHQQIDPPLSELGRQQARLVAASLSTGRIDHVYASPMKRALETGREIARHHRLEPTVLDDLREVGVFAEMPPDKTPLEYIGRRALAGARERMMVEKSWDVYPYSESSHDFRKRVINAIEGIIVTHPDERVVIACHGGVINAYVGHIIGSRYDMFFRPAHTSVNVIAGGEGRRALYRLNDTHHLMSSEGSFISL
ncbi:MAG: histidine phosphatase family protein [Chloroflexi bacterium]|nr:histidine phosphatase family protein [Chloroflexota bacterium]